MYVRKCVIKRATSIDTGIDLPRCAGVGREYFTTDYCIVRDDLRMAVTCVRHTSKYNKFYHDYVFYLNTIYRVYL